MGRKSAVRVLEADMRTYFAEQGLAEVIAFGELALTQQLNQLPAPNRAGRVVIVPNDETGKAGKLAAAREIGRRPRQVYGVDHIVEIHCWGRDVTATKSDEGAHYDVAFDLYEAAMCGVRNSQVGRVAFDELRHINAVKEARFGFCIVQRLIVQGGVYEPDVAIAEAPLTPAIDQNVMKFPDGDVAD